MSTSLNTVQTACNAIRQHVPADFQPKIGIILGSGLGPFADDIKNAVAIPYQNIPGFPVSSVPGHAGRLVLGELGGVSVMCMQGRVHRYEGADDEDFKVLVRSFKLMGCETLIVTNASGSLRKEVGPGELVLITDHINMQLVSPLMGRNDEEFGQRFLPMENTYDLDLRKQLKKTADELNITVHEGVNMSVMGPCYETPAEIRAFRILGADIVNMSTIPEVILARHCGLNVLAMSVVTNFGAGMAENISHDDVLLHAARGGDELRRLLASFISSIN